MGRWFAFVFLVSNTTTSVVLYFIVISWFDLWQNRLLITPSEFDVKACFDFQLPSSQTRALCFFDLNNKQHGIPILLPATTNVRSKPNKCVVPGLRPFDHGFHFKSCHCPFCHSCFAIIWTGFGIRDGTRFSSSVPSLC